MSSRERITPTNLSEVEIFSQGNPNLEIAGLEIAGLKELCSQTEFMFSKRGGREPGVHMWGR